jgi:dipeptidyl aminopeptidase/acylaminoacyl peptidase
MDCELTLRGAGVDIEARLFEPSEAATNGVVLIPGFKGTAGDLSEAAAMFAEAGYLSVAISMRGFGASGGRDDCGLRQPDDVIAVVEWMHEQLAPAEGRIGLMGISQGGQVALLAAIRGAGTAAVAAWSAVTDVASWRETSETLGIREYIDAVCRDGAYIERSPLALADRLTVPVLLIHGDRDTRVPTDQSVRLRDALAAKGRSSRLELLPGVGHHRERSGNTRAFDTTASFFRQELSGISADAGRRDQARNGRGERQ